MKKNKGTCYQLQNNNSISLNDSNLINYSSSINPINDLELYYTKNQNKYLTENSLFSKSNNNFIEKDEIIKYKVIENYERIIQNLKDEINILEKRNKNYQIENEKLKSALKLQENKFNINYLSIENQKYFENYNNNYELFYKKNLDDLSNALQKIEELNKQLSSLRKEKETLLIDIENKKNCIESLKKENEFVRNTNIIKIKQEEEDIKPLRSINNNKYIDSEKDSQKYFDVISQKNDEICRISQERARNENDKRLLEKKINDLNKLIDNLQKDNEALHLHVMDYDEIKYELECYRNRGINHAYKEINNSKLGKENKRLLEENNDLKKNIDILKINNDY